MNAFPIFPREASSFAPKTDALYFTLVAVSGSIALLVFALIIVFAARYRRGSSAPRGALAPLIQHEFEIGWTTATLFAFLMLFWWAGSNQIYQLLPPAQSDGDPRCREAMDVEDRASQRRARDQHAARPD